jgi:hypothetical protein
MIWFKMLCELLGAIGIFAAGYGLLLIGYGLGY